MKVAKAGPSVFDQRLRARLRPSPMPRLTPSPSTTRQARVLNPAVAGSPGMDTGLAVGRDETSQTAYYQDTFTRYEEKKSSNPNVVVVGPLGVGKSLLVKTLYIERQLQLLRRRAVVLDLKARGRDGDSEYGELARNMRGGQSYLLWPGHPECVRLNVLDPVILAGGGETAAASLLSAIAELGGSGPLDALEFDVLSVAHREVLRKHEDIRTPTLTDLVPLLTWAKDAPVYRGFGAAALDAVDLAALNVATRLRRALARDVAGLFDGDTSREVTADPKLAVYNIANLPKQGPALGMVMAVAHAQLMGRLRYNHAGWRTTLVMEEAWQFAAVAREIRANSKLARGFGLSNIGIVQHVSDTPPGSDGEVLIREAGTAHLFRQEQQVDRDDCVAAFGLNPDNAALLGTLKQGEHLLKTGGDREVHIRGMLTDREMAMAETDAAMMGNRR